MAKHGLIAGKYTENMKKLIEESGSNLVFNRTWEDFDEIITDVARGGLGVVSELDSILILDASFKYIDSSAQSITELIELQNIFNTQNVEKVKIYLLTTSSNIYNEIKKKEVISDPLIYENTYVVYCQDESKLSNIMIQDVFNGKYDSFADTLKMDGKRELTRNERLELDLEKIREDSNKYSKLEDGVTTYNELSINDGIDSDYNREKIRRMKQEEDLRARHPERYTDDEDDNYTEDNTNTLKKVSFGKGKSTGNKKVSGVKPNLSDTYEADEEFEDNINVYEDADDTLTELDKSIQKRYLSIKSNINGISSQKLLTDKGVVSFIGRKGSGTSGLVSQTAEVYASLGKSVLVVDLDILERSQTSYFPNYSDKVDNGKGLTDSLLKAIQGVAIKKCAVSVTSKIDILSISRDYKEELGVSKSISPLLRKVISKSKKDYDMILIDIPFIYMNDYLRNINKIVDRNVFVVENKYYEVENLFAIELESILDGNNGNDLMSLIQKSVVILNKCNRGNRTLDGSEITLTWIKDLLQRAGNPFDNLFVAGELPFYEDWEKQYFTNVRRVLDKIEDDRGITLSLYRDVVSKIIL